MDYFRRMFRTVVLFLLLLVPAIRVIGQCTVVGVLRAAEGAVPFAHVVLEGTTIGAVTDVSGRFEVAVPCGTPLRLVCRSMGLRTRTIDVPGIEAGQRDLGMVLLQADASELDEVVVTGTMRAISRSESPVPVEVITPALFRKDPSPALFDAVAMVNGVRPQINCGVCNTGDIHINGMEGPYTMILIDGMPILSGLSTVYGLSGIPLSLIERVEVVKGPGSSLYGSEAMGGIINVITKDPVLAPRLSVEAMTTSWQEHSLDLGARFRHGKVNDLLGVNVFHYDDPRDRNGDGFTDVTLQQRVSIFNKIAVQRRERRVANLAGRYVHEDRWGGQMAWTPAFAGGDSIYGESIATRRWELIGQYQLPLPGSVMLQVSANGHQQRSWYGTMPYDADQQVMFGQLYWTKRFGARHDLLTGLAYRHTHYDDNTVATTEERGGVLRNAPDRRPLPGLFVQDEWSITEVHKLLAGYRLDHDRDHGLVQNPRLAYKWAPNGRWAVRANFGTGFRVVNLFTEEHAALTGSRAVVIEEDLQPERSVNGTLNVVRKWPGEHHFFGVDASLFYTHFSNRILPDYTTANDLILYRNLAGRAVSRGVSVNLEARLGEKLRLLAGATYMEVFTETQGVRADQFFAPRWSGTFTASYQLPERWSVDLTGQAYGPMRLPTLQNDYRPDHSPAYALINIQMKKSVHDRLEVYGGVKNLLDFRPTDPLMRPFDPFDRTAGDTSTNPNGYTFDTTYIYASLQGIRGYIGVRWVLG